MSANKRKYFYVTTTKLVSANNKSDALQAAQGKRGIDANVLWSETDGERISADRAKTYTA